MNVGQLPTDHPPPPAASQRPRLFGDDTAPSVEQYLIEGYRHMSRAEKLACARALNQATVALALSDIRRQHPQANQREVQANQREVLLRLASRRLGPALVRRAFGWDVAQEGY